MAKRSNGGADTVTATVKGNTLVITVPLNAAAAYVNERGTRVFKRTPFMAAEGQFDGKPVAFTVTACEGRNR